MSVLCPRRPLFRPTNAHAAHGAQQCQQCGSACYQSRQRTPFHPLDQRSCTSVTWSSHTFRLPGAVSASGLPSVGPTTSPLTPACASAPRPTAFWDLSPLPTRLAGKRHTAAGLNGRTSSTEGVPVAASTRTGTQPTCAKRCGQEGKVGGKRLAKREDQGATLSHTQQTTVGQIRQCWQ